MKAFNHLYKNIELDPTLIEDFVYNCTEKTREFEENTKENLSFNSTSEADEVLEVSVQRIKCGILSTID